MQTSKALTSALVSTDSKELLTAIVSVILVVLLSDGLVYWVLSCQRSLLGQDHGDHPDNAELSIKPCVEYS